MTEQSPDVAQPSEKNTTGEVDPAKWQEAKAVTGRPNDVPEDNSTFAERAKARRADVAKADTPAKPAKKTAKPK